MKTCETCGQRVRIYSTNEGTNSYDGIDAEELETVKRKLGHALEWFGDIQFNPINAYEKATQAIKDIEEME